MTVGEAPWDGLAVGWTFGGAVLGWVMVGPEMTVDLGVKQGKGDEVRGVVQLWRWEEESGRLGGRRAGGEDGATAVLGRGFGGGLGVKAQGGGWDGVFF